MTEKRDEEIWTEATVLGAFLGWFLILVGALALQPPDDHMPGGPNFDALVWDFAVIMGHFISLPGLMVAAFKLARRHGWRAFGEGFVIAFVHFVIGLLLLGIAMLFGGPILALVVGIPYLPLSWLWGKCVETHRAAHPHSEPS